MLETGINHYILLSALVLGLGIFITLTSKNLVRIIAGVIMIFTASLINISALTGLKTFNPEGQIILYIATVICLLLVVTGALLWYNHYKENASAEIND